MRTRKKADIEAEDFLELEPGGGDLKDETAKPTTLDVENLRGNIVLGFKLLGDETMAAVGTLIVPNVLKLSGPDETGL